MSKPHNLLARLSTITELPALVPRLQPDLLHRLIQRCGLEDCAELVALATPAQLARVLDADVWQARTPGADESFDPERFGVWITVLMQAGADVAADKLAALDTSLIVKKNQR